MAEYIRTSRMWGLSYAKGSGLEWIQSTLEDELTYLSKGEFT